MILLINIIGNLAGINATLSIVIHNGTQLVFLIQWTQLMLVITI